GEPARRCGRATDVAHDDVHTAEAARVGRSQGTALFDLQMRDRSFAHPERVAEVNRAPRERTRYHPDNHGRCRTVLDHVLDLEPRVIFLGHLFDPLAQLEDAAPSLPFICHDGVRSERSEHRLYVLTIDRLEVRLER